MFVSLGSLQILQFVVIIVVVFLRRPEKPVGATSRSQSWGMAGRPVMSGPAELCVPMRQKNPKNLLGCLVVKHSYFFC